MLKFIKNCWPIFLTIGLCTVMSSWTLSHTSTISYVCGKTYHAMTHGDEPYPYADPRPSIGAEVVLEKFDFEPPIDPHTGDTFAQDCRLPKGSTMRIIGEAPENRYFVRRILKEGECADSKSCPTKDTTFVIKSRQWTWWVDDVNKRIATEKERAERAPHVKKALDAISKAENPLP